MSLVISLESFVRAQIKIVLNICQTIHWLHLECGRAYYHFLNIFCFSECYFCNLKNKKG